MSNVYKQMYMIGQDEYKMLHQQQPQIIKPLEPDNKPVVVMELSPIVTVVKHKC